MKISGKFEAVYHEDDLKILIAADLTRRNIAGKVVSVSMKELGRMEDNCLQITAYVEMPLPEESE